MDDSDTTGRCLNSPPGAADWAKTLPLYPLPQHAISRLVHWFTRLRTGWIRRPFTRWFVSTFKVDMSEALETNPLAYEHFNAFFTRALKADARPLPQDPDGICSPADGVISAMGPINADTILQAKGHGYSLTTLLGGDKQHARAFYNGTFMTVYLSPRDYHRVHMPLAGTLRQMVHVPGRLFSVGRHTVRTVPRLFARNERVVCLFDTLHGPMAVVLVGAINVASIETTWAGEVTPPRGRAVRSWHYDGSTVAIARGKELGRFNMGSTAIIIFPRGMARLDSDLQADQNVKVGQQIGKLNKTSPENTTPHSQDETQKPAIVSH